MTDEDRPESGAADASPAEPAGQAEALPDRIGPYRILKSLGRGGMGVVYLAEQTEPVRRQVALKVIQTALRDRETTLRFESERQAMARLSHPNIAQMFEAGTTTDGHLFFAMELVDGKPITDHCDQRRLTIRERLQLMRAVCDGVQHAHHKGILHRDLKPANILVTEIESQPVPKIIDFGIAKAIDQPLVDGTLFTGDRLIGTPAYLAPEAVEVVDGGLDIDTRFDVYSLGILLYELLVGARPFETRGAPFLQVLRRITEDEPTGPSTRWRTLDADTRERVAARRRLALATVKRRLQGDLDWIVLKAIAKDRRERYGSPAELSADLLRHLEHRPVVASPPSALYRVAKFVRRRRGVVAAAGLLVLSLLLGLAGTTVGLVRAHREAETARKALEETREVSAFLADLFEVSAPGEARGNTITARELLERGAEKIRAGFEDQPLARARFMLTIGNIYRKLGLYEEAAELLEQSLEIREQHLVPDHLDVATSLQSLGILYRSQARYEEAETVYQRALAIRERNLGPDHASVASSLSGLGALYFVRRRYDEAEPLYERALVIRERALGPDHPGVAQGLINLGNLFLKQERHEEAKPLYERALAIQERALGSDHPDVAMSLYNLGGLYSAQGRYKEAEPLVRRALAIEEKVLGPDHPGVATSLLGLSWLCRKQGRYEEAEPLCLRALEIRERVLGPDHPDVARTLVSLGLVYWQQGRYDDAEPFYQRVLEIRERTLAPGHPDILATRADYAELLRALGREAEATELETRREGDKSPRQSQPNPGTEEP